MFKFIILTVISICSVVNADDFFTFPLTHMRLNNLQTQKYHEFKVHHLRHLSAEYDTETYPLHSINTLFTLSLNINGLNYNLSVDTGSSDIFIKGQDLEGSPKQKFSCKKCVTENQQIKIGYLDGKLNTYLYNSTVKLGNHTFNENILVAYETNNIQNFMQIGGIVGLSFQEIAKNPYPNFMKTLIKQKIISKYKFGLKLNFKDPEASFITFGGIDHKYIDPEHQIIYYNIMQQKFSYRLQTTKIHFGEKQLDLNVALMDSGNTCVSIDASYTDQMLEEMNLSGNQCKFQDQSGNTIFKLLVCNITDFDALPVITLVMPDGNTFSWQKQYYIDTCTLKQGTQDNPIYHCQTYIESVNKKRQKMIYLGAAWMLKYYSVFDIDKKQVGMAKNIDNLTLQRIFKQSFKKSQSLPQTDDEKSQ